MSAPNEDALRGGATQGIKGQAISASPNCEARRKFEATCIARGALRGIQVHRLTDGTYMVARHGLSRQIDTLEELDVWLVKAGAA